MRKSLLFFAIAACFALSFATLANFKVKRSQPIGSAVAQCFENDNIKKIGQVLEKRPSNHTIAIMLSNSAYRFEDHLGGRLLKLATQNALMFLPKVAQAEKLCSAASVKVNNITLQGVPEIQEFLLQNGLATSDSSLSIAICAGSDHFAFVRSSEVLNWNKDNLAQRCESFYMR